MHYMKGKGLLVQDYSPKAKGWSKSAVVHKTKTDACQGITLKAKDGTVAAFGDFGVYCADGEPPTESVAAVATGPLTKWATHLTKNFDGWEKIAVAPRGKEGHVQPRLRHARVDEGRGLPRRGLNLS